MTDKVTDAASSIVQMVNEWFDVSTATTHPMPAGIIERRLRRFLLEDVRVDDVVGALAPTDSASLLEVAVCLKRIADTLEEILIMQQAKEHL